MTGNACPPYQLSASSLPVSALTRCNVPFPPLLLPCLLQRPPPGYGSHYGGHYGGHHGGGYSRPPPPAGEETQGPQVDIEQLEKDLERYKVGGVEGWP